MTYYLIAKNEAGQIVAKRASQSTPYAYATARGTFHSRADLVPAGQKAYKVEQISAAEYRALVKAETDAPDRLRDRVARIERNAASYTAQIARAEERLNLDHAALPRRERKSDWSDRVWTELQVGEEWIPSWALEPDRLSNEIARLQVRLAECNKALAATQKRLAAAERKAAKAS